LAATYLQLPGTTADDLISAPATIDLGRRPIHNAGGGPCPGTTPDGRITLTQAIAVSCNTAFVALARDLGWPKIRDTAEKFGFTVGPTDVTAPAWLAQARLGVDSRVPENSDEAGLGNNVLGGGSVAGTPLQMATVMAAVANSGTVRQPVLVTSITAPDGGERHTITGESRPVLDTDQAAQLTLALAKTVQGGGTAAGLRTPDGRALWVKTGTHELGEQARGEGTFVRQISWLTGFLDTANGRVAFAVAVETRDERAGADRTRMLARRTIESITEVRH